jgi:hypothetical protein
MPDTWIRVCRDFIDYDIEDFDSEDSAWPWEDMKKYDYQFRGGKATGSAAEVIVLDLGEAKELNLFALYNVNFASYAILGNTTPDMTTPAYDSGAITVNQNKATERYVSVVNPQDYAAFDYRYVALEIPSGTPLDGSSQHFVGNLAVSEDAESLIGNTSPGLQFRTPRPRQDVQMLSGAPRSINRGPRLAELVFTRQVLRTSEYWEQVCKYFLTLDTDNVLLFEFNGLLLEGGGSNEEYAFFVKGTSDPMYTLQNRGVADLSGIALKEVG